VPHVILPKLPLPELPREVGEFTFEFASPAKEAYGIIGVRYQEFRFLLHYFPHQNGVILKVDKTTRIPHLNIVKRSLAALVELAGVKPSQSNIQITKPDRTYRALKSADFFAKEYAYEREIWVEIGFGSGRHLLHNANTHSDIDHLGVEIHKPSIEQVLKQCELQDLDNVSVIALDARVVLETLRSNSVGRIFVHFPVPWDKAPHRRVMHPAFIQEAIRVLKPGGTLELRTDSREYFEYSLGLLNDLQRCDFQGWKNRELAVSSKYEDRWKRMERDIFDLIFVNRENSEPLETQTDYGFDDIRITYAEAVEKLKEQIIAQDSILLKMSLHHPLPGDDGMIKLVLGPIQFPQTIFLYIRNRLPQYYPEAPLSIPENRLAHEALVNLLKA